jgi:hypothetical protein
MEDNIKMDLKEIGWGVRTECLWFTTVTRGMLFQHGNEFSCANKCGEFFY